MKFRTRIAYIAKASMLVIASCISVTSVQAASDASTIDEAKKLFAVEIKVGPNWDSSITPGKQKFFREHSANLKRHRDTGHIVLGARYSDIGLIIFSATSVEEVRAMMSEDPSMTAGTFQYEVHQMNVFYPGLVQP